MVGGGFARAAADPDYGRISGQPGRCAGDPLPVGTSWVDGRCLVISDWVVVLLLVLCLTGGLFWWVEFLRGVFASVVRRLRRKGRADV
jgi:hypothetical protein